MSEEWIDTTEAADILGFTRTWVATLCREGILEAEGGGRGRQWRILRDSVEELANANADPDDLERLKEEIERDQDEFEEAIEEGQKSWVEWLIDKAKQYGPGVLRVIAGIAYFLDFPNAASICNGLAEIIKASRRPQRRS